MPEACGWITEAPPRPLEAPLRGSPADLELVLVGVANERLARGPARRHLEDAALVVVVGEQIEVEILTHVRLREERKLPQVVERLDVVRCDAEIVEQIGRAHV